MNGLTISPAVAFAGTRASGPATGGVSEIDGVRLLDPATFERMTVVHTNRTRMNGLPPGLDIPADRSFYYMSLEFWQRRRLREPIS